MTKKQHYMTEKERYKLEGLLEAKVPVAQIARQMGFCRQTIYNEIQRGQYIHTCDFWDETRYSADKAQQLHDRSQTAKGRPIKLGNDHALAQFLEDKMLGIQEDGSIDKRKRYSPAAALAEARKAGYTLTLCVSTLYSYIDKGGESQQEYHDLQTAGQNSFLRPNCFRPAGENAAGFQRAVQEHHHGQRLGISPVSGAVQLHPRRQPV